MISHRLRLLGILSVAALAACARPVAPVEEPSAPPLPETDYARAVQAGAAVFRIDPQRSLILVRVGRAGKMRRLGHDHAVASEDVQGFVAIYDDVERSHADIVFPLRNLLIDKAAYRERLALDSDPSADDIAGTYGNMLKVLEPELFPWADLRARFVSGRLGNPVLGVSITLHGLTHEYLLPAAVEISDVMLQATGEVTIRHSEFGLEPYSAAGGLLRVADEMDVQFRLVARRVEGF